MRIFATLALLCLSASAAADVVTGPPQGYTEEVAFGEAAFETTYRTPNGVPYRRGLGAAAGIERHAVAWKPGDLPAYVETGVDARGGYLLLSTLLADPDGRSACWTEVAIREHGAFLRARVQREVERWVQSCPAVRTIGTQLVVGRWAAARHDMRRALARLASVQGVRYLDDPARVDGRMFGLPSFLPQTIDQPVLNAIADQCGLPRSNLRRQGQVVAVRSLITGAQESNADGRVNGCVQRATDNLPGIRREMN